LAQILLVVLHGDSVRVLPPMAADHVDPCRIGFT
jgi:hypothetical protein